MSQEPQHHQQPPFEVPSIEEMGALLPQYAFEKLAAYGGMGAVYKARQESLDRPVAIKILPPAFGAEPEFAERFKTEARAMAKLNHSNIVGVYDFGITVAGHFYLVMEWIEGPTLHDLIHKQGKLPMKRAAALTVQLCDALSYAHNHRILHRDIKPGNIMINQEEQVKVTDFGLARPITGEAEENPYGTPDYAAPEILNKGAVDQRADIYAAGLVLYEMLTGEVPKSPRPSVTLQAPVPKSWDNVIDMATHPDPEKRLMDARDLRAHVLNLVNRAEAVAIPTAAVAVEEPAKRGKSGLKPLHYGMIGALGAVVLGVGMASMFRSSPKDDSASKPTNTAQVKSADDAPERPKKKRPASGGEIAASPAEDSGEKTVKKKREPVVAESVPVTKPERVQEEPKRDRKAVPETMTAALAKAEPAPAPVLSPPEDPHAAIQRLEEKDPELTQMVTTFSSEWEASGEIDTMPETRELGSKYVPALQRILTGLQPEQRDYVLTEISHVSNFEPLEQPAETWPPALKVLRQAYNAQAESIQSVADAAAEKLRSDHCAKLIAKAKERETSGNIDGARRAEALAALLAKLQGQPTIKAVKDSLAMTTAGNGATR